MLDGEDSNVPRDTVKQRGKLLVYDIDIYLLLQKDTNVRYKTARAIS